MSTKYPRGNYKFHPNDVIENMQAFKEALKDCNLDLEELDFESTWNELREMVLRNTPQKPDGKWDGVPRCPCCGQRVRAGSSKYSQVQDTHCRKCGQLIDWSEVQRYAEKDG